MATVPPLTNLLAFEAVARRRSFALAAAELHLTASAISHQVARLEAMGATRVDIGQSGDESWVVLADPEGNELCVLQPKST